MKKAIKGLALLLVLTLVWAGSASAEVIRGKVSSVDLKTDRISMDLEGKERSFTFDPQDFIVWKGDDEVKAEEIKTGSDAEIGYYKDETGLEIASWVDLTPLEEGGELIATPGEASLPTEAIGNMAPAATTESLDTMESPGEEVSTE